MSDEALLIILRGALKALHDCILAGDALCDRVEQDYYWRGRDSQDALIAAWKRASAAAAEPPEKGGGE